MHNRWLAGAVFVGLFGLYAWTAARGVPFHDSGELITGACTLGIPHPPGSPTWCLAGYLFSLIPFGSPAWRVNIMSGFWAAGTCAIVYLLLVRMLRRSADRPETLWRAHVAGLFGALVLASCKAFWEEAGQAELYTMNTCFFAGALYVYSAWQAAVDQNEVRHRSLLVGLSLLFGVGCGNYLALLYLAPVLCVAGLWRRPGLLKDYRLLIKMLAAFGLGCALYLYLPLRSLVDPPLDWGNPETWRAFKSVMQREYWGKLAVSGLTRDFIVQWVRQLGLIEQFGAIVLALALGGIVVTAVRNRLTAFVLVGAFYAHGLAMMWMQATTPALTRGLEYVTTYELAEFNLPLYLIAAVFAGAGFHGFVALLGRTDRLKPDTRAGRVVLAAGGAGLVLTGFVSGFKEGDFRHFRQPVEFGAEILNRTPRGAWILPGSDNAMFILTYLKYVEGVRRDICLVSPSPAVGPVLAQELIPAGTNKAARMASLLAGMIRQQPDRFLLPLLNQPELFAAYEPDVVFVKLPSWGPLNRYLTPDGIVFKAGGRGGYDEARQADYWHTLLRAPGFALTVDAKQDFRENMMLVLHDHAWWHDVAHEYDLACFLYEQAIAYAPAPGAALFAGAAACTLELGDTAHAAAYARQALAVDDRNRRALETLGIASAARGQYATALACMERLVQLFPDDIAARRNLDKVRRDAGGTTNANRRAGAEREPTGDDIR